MTSIIDQADSIVGTNTNVSHLDKKGKEWIRRWAYSDWCANNNVNGVSMGMALKDIAQAIVSHHAASKPKGDGLPETISFSTRSEGIGTPNGERDFIIEFGEPMNGKERDAVAFYFMRCLTPPVRRLLAAFDVVESRSVEVNKLNTVMLHRNGQDICWLVPKGAK